MKPLSVLVIGAGAIVEKFHLPALARNKSLIVKGIIDINQDQALRIGKKFDIPVINNFRDIHTDICLVATPPHVRKTLINEILKDQRNVVCEKPLAYTAAEAEEMIKTATQNDQKLFVAQSRRFSPNIIALRELIKAGYFNDSIEIFHHEGAPYNWTSVSSDRGIYIQGDFGIIHDLGAHVFDVIALLLKDLKIHMNDLIISSIIDRRKNPNNCSVKIKNNSNANKIQIFVKISRTVNLCNKLVVKDKNKKCVIKPLFEKDFFKLQMNDNETFDLYYPLWIRNITSMNASFSMQWDSIAKSIYGNENFETLGIEASSVLPSIKLIDRIIQVSQVKRFDSYFIGENKGW